MQFNKKNVEQHILLPPTALFLPIDCILIFDLHVYGIDKKGDGHINITLLEEFKVLKIKFRVQLSSSLLLNW